MYLLIKCLGLPSHLVKLMKGVPMMSLRNIDQTIGFCNSTRFIIVELGINIIGAEIISKIILILCFDVLIFVMKNQLCSINYNKKLCILHYLGLI